MVKEKVCCRYMGEHSQKHRYGHVGTGRSGKRGNQVQQPRRAEVQMGRATNQENCYRSQEKKLPKRKDRLLPLQRVSKTPF